MSAYTLNVTVENNVVEIDATENTVSFEIGQVLGTNPTGAVTSVAGRTGAVTLTSADLTDTTAAGRALLDDANAAAQRTTLGLGTIATQAADAVAITGGTLQSVGVVTGSYTSKVNEALLRSARKASAGTITKGQVVYVTGSTGSHVEVELAEADSELASSKTFGVAVETITNSQEGYVMLEGLLEGLSNLPTASFANGDPLFLSTTAGAWQNTQPTQPNHGVYLGRVINASNGANGSAFIKIINGQELGELHDVLISGLADKHGLFYEASTTLWKNRLALLSDLGASGATTGQRVRYTGSAWSAFTEYGYVYAQASAFAEAATNGAAADKLETSTNKLNIDRYLFDAATAEQVWISFAMPEDWNLGTFKARLYWTADSGSGGVTWGIAGVATSNDDALDVALGTEVLVSDTLLTAGDAHETDATAAITVGGTPAQRDLIHLRVRRVPSDGSDTLAVDAALLGVWIQYTRTSAPAAW